MLDSLSEPALRSSWIAKELQDGPQRPAAVARWGGSLGTLYAGLDMWLRQLGIGCRGR